MRARNILFALVGLFAFVGVAHAFLPLVIAAAEATPLLLEEGATLVEAQAAADAAAAAIANAQASAASAGSQAATFIEQQIESAMSLPSSNVGSKVGWVLLRDFGKAILTLVQTDRNDSDTPSVPAGWTVSSGYIQPVPTRAPNNTGPSQTEYCVGANSSHCFISPQAAANAIDEAKSCAYSGSTYCVAPGDSPWPLSGNQGINDWYAYYASPSTSATAVSDIEAWQSAGTPIILQTSSACWYQFGDENNFTTPAGGTLYFDYDVTSNCGNFVATDGIVGVLQNTGGASCDVGYTLSADGTTCNLTNAKAVAQALPAKGVCYVRLGPNNQPYIVPGDVDCTQLQNLYVNGANVAYQGTGGNAASLTFMPNGQVQISKDIPDPTTNATQNQNTSIAPQTTTDANGNPVTNSVNNGSSTNWFPGQGINSSPVEQIIQNLTNSTPSNPAQTTTSTVSAAAPVQVINLPNPMPVTFDAGTFNGNTPDAPSTPDFLQPIREKFNPLMNYALPGHDDTCEPLEINIPSFGWSTSTTVICDQLEAVRPILRPSVLVGYLILALFIFLSA